MSVSRQTYVHHRLPSYVLLEIEWEHTLRVLRIYKSAARYRWSKGTSPIHEGLDAGPLALIRG